MARITLCFVVLVVLPYTALCQSFNSLFSEDFDSLAAPGLPSGWLAEGFTVSSSVPRSAPNAAAATGNMGFRELRSPVIDFGGAIPAELVFYERRSNTAAQYRLEVSGSIDGFDSLIFRETFDAIPVLSSYAKRTLDLSAMAAGAIAEMQIRWSILPDSTNATGVLRIDDVALIGRAAQDVAIDQVLVKPYPVSSMDTVLVHACLRNVGVLAVADYVVEFFLDDEGDRLPNSEDRFAVLAGPPLDPDASIVVQAVRAPLRPGPYVILVAVSSLEDGNPTNDTASVELRVGAPAGSVVINEIMYAPVEDEPEWIELLNVTTDTVSLTGWTVSDHGLSKKALVGTVEPELAPGQYGIVAKDASFLTIHPIVPGPVFTADFSSLNNSSADGPILFSDQNVTIDSVQYDPAWGGQAGRSLERRDTHRPSNDASIWATCADSLGSTPGRENSTALLAFDLALHSVVPISGGNGEDVHLHITVVNAGTRAVPDHEVAVFDDMDDDRHGAESEQIALLLSQETLPPGDFLRHECTFAPAFPGEHLVIATVRFDSDQRASNDEGYAVVVMRDAPGALIINEIMYEPLEGSCEWVELYNPNGSEVDLHGWVLSDIPTASGSVNRFLIAEGHHSVPSGGFVVVAADSTILGYQFSHVLDTIGAHVVVAGRSTGLGFSNDGDVVVVRDAAGYNVDSLAYDPGMHHPHVPDVRGRSLERIRPDGPTNDRSNWSTASGLAGGSPGRRNSISVSIIPNGAMISIHPNPFSPDEDGWEDFCVIVLELPFPTATLRARVFDTRGRMIRTLAFAENVGAHSRIIWNGLDDRQGRVPIGPYVILVEATDPLSGRHMVHKAVAVVGRRL